ncbi:glycosyltransferase [Mycobacterium tuberculosis]|nr:glycosyltransferase [Mycobacterium tuberculosis]
MAPPERNPRGILFVGRLVEEKRVDLLLKAFKPVSERYPDARLTIVGSGPQRPELEKQLSGLQLNSVVRFAGAIYDPVELGKEFLRNSIFVLPGLGGLSINEAMFYGLAIVCSRGDGTERHLVRSDHNGVFFHEGDEKHLAGVLMNLLDDTDRLRQMGERSKEIIRCEVNINTVIAEYIRAFQYVVDPLD